MSINKRMAGLLALILMTISMLTPIAATARQDGGMLSWIGGAYTRISDVYFEEREGERAFVAQGLTHVPADAVVYMTVEPSGNALVTITGVSVSTGAGIIEAIAIDITDDATGAGLYSFAMPQGDAVVSVLTEVTPTYSIIPAIEGQGVVQTFPSGSLLAGTVVTVSPIPLTGWRLDGFAVMGSDGGELELNDNSFVMPEQDCSVAARFVPVTHELALSDDAGRFVMNAEYIIESDGDAHGIAAGVPAGALVTVKVQPRGEYKLRDAVLYAPDGARTLSVMDGQAQFVMPDGNCEVAAFCTDAEHFHDESRDIEPWEAVVITDSDGLRLRSASEADSDIIATYATGTHVTVNGTTVDGEWAHVVVDDGNSGWMKAEYLTRESSVEGISINIILPPINVQSPYLIEQEKENVDGVYRFRHILFF